MQTITPLWFQEQPGFHRFLRKFWRQVKRTDGCWLWIGKLERGYGSIAVGPKRGPRIRGAHRLSWLLHGNTIPEGMFVLHRCDVRCCVRPDHLFVGTQAENMADMVKKGRSLPCHRYGTKHGMAKLTEDQVREIRSSKIERGSIPRLAVAYGVSRSAIGLILSGDRWRHILPPPSHTTAS